VSFKRTAVYTAGIVAGLLLVLVVTGYFVLRSSAFHRFAVFKLEKLAGAKLGTRVNIKSFDLHLANLSLDLNGITIEGNGPSPYGPLLYVDHIGVNIKIISVWRREWDLNSITVDRPIAHVFVNKTGTSNIPTPQTSGSQTNIFDLAVRHALLNQGQVYYNDREYALKADLHDLHFQSTYASTAGGSYYGTLGYRDGTFQYGNYSPLRHNLEAKFDANRNELKLDPVNLAVGPSHVELSATLQDYSNPKIQASYRASLDGSEFRQVLKNPDIPSGMILLTGTGQYQHQPNTPVLNSITLNGQVTSTTLLVNTSGYRGEIRDLSARYSIANGNATLQDLQGKVFGGTLTAGLTVRDLIGKMQAQLDATLRDISAGAVQSLAAAGSLQDVRLIGTTSATVKASWSGSLQNLSATADASLHARAVPREAAKTAATPSGIPVDALVHARYAGKIKMVSLTESYIHLPQTSISFNGTVSERSSLQIAMQSNDLHELETVVNAFRTSSPESPAQPLDLYGTASFNGSIQGSTANPHLQGQLIASNFRIRETSWRLLRADVQADPSLLSVQNADLEPVQQGHIGFALQTGLRRWSFTPESQFNVRLGISHINVADLARLANSPVHATGTLNSNIAMHGTQLSPFGQGTVVVTHGSVGSEPVQAVTLSFQGTGGELHGTLGTRMPAGSATSRFTYYPQQQGYDLMLQVADLQLAKLHAIQQRHLDLSGALNLTASGKGSLKNPNLTLTAQIPTLQFHEQTIRGLTLQGNVEQHIATLDLTSQAVNTGIRAHGTVGLTDGYQADVRVDTGPIPLEPLLATYMPQAADVSGQTELHATLRGPLKNRAQLEMHAQLPVLSLSYQNFEIAAVHPVLINYAHGVLAVQRSEIRGPDTDLQFQGNIPVRSSAPLSLLLLGTVDLRILRAFEPDLRSSGQLQFDINSFGQAANPNFKGQIHIVNANLTMTGAPLGLQNGNGVLTLTGRRIDVSSFQGQVGGGTVTARGGVVVRPAILFDLAVTGNGITLLYPRGVRSSIDTDLTLTGNTQTALLRGQVHLDRLSFTPDFDLSSFTQQMTNEVSSPPSAGFANNVQLQIVLQTGAGLNLVSRTLSLQGGANLRIQGTAAEPVVLGRADITGGDVIFLANRYVIQGGSVAFVNPTRTEPVVNVAATTTIDQYNINLRLEGPVDRLRTTYSSDPSLPPVDIINLLAFGKTTEAQAANANAGGTLGPESVLASGISSQVAGRLQRIAGISQLSIDPVLGPNQGAQGARITVQQRVTSNLFVTFSSDVTSTQEQTIQVQYQLNQRWAVSADRDQNGGFGFDARVHKSF
jgi:translocation and assembly module TamB